MFVRLINTIIILLLIDCFGILPESTILKVIVDVLLLGLSFYIILRKRRESDEAEKYIRNIFLFFLIVTIYTYLCGGSTLGDIYKFIRIYFPLLFVIPLMYDINYTKDGFKYYLKVFKVIELCVSIMLLLISVFHLGIFSSWPRLTYGYQDGDYIPGLLRVYIFSSFTFPIVEFIFLVYSLFLGIKVNKILFTLITIGFVLQGFRSYILATILIVIISIFNFLRKQRGFSLMKLIKRNFIIFILVAFVGSTFIGKRIASGVSDFVNVSGTFGARVLLDAFRLKVFSENILFGVGFLHNDSQRAKDMGVTSSQELRAALTEDNSDVLQQSAIYSLRATDSGYLDLLIQFGVIGCILFFILYFSIYNKYGKFLKIDSNVQLRIYLLATRTVVLLLIFTLISHSGLTNVYGLLPLAFVLSFAQYQVNLNRSSKSISTLSS